MKAPLADRAMKCKQRKPRTRRAEPADSSGLHSSIPWGLQSFTFSTHLRFIFHLASSLSISVREATSQLPNQDAVYHFCSDKQQRDPIGLHTYWLDPDNISLVARKQLEQRKAVRFFCPSSLHTSTQKRKDKDTDNAQLVLKMWGRYLRNHKWEAS